MEPNSLTCDECLGSGRSAGRSAEPDVVWSKPALRAPMAISPARAPLLSMEIPDEVQIRERFQLPHNGIAVVIRESTIIGNEVPIYPDVTIGRAGLYHLWAETSVAGGVVVGDKFVIGSGAKVLFKSAETLTLGDDSVIGANAVVTGSVPPREVRAGIPAVKVGMNSALVG